MKQVVGINVRGEGTGLLSVVVPAYNDEKLWLRFMNAPVTSWTKYLWRRKSFTSYGMRTAGVMSIIV